MKIQWQNLMKHKVFTVGITINKYFFSIAFGVVALFIYKEEKENESER